MTINNNLTEKLVSFEVAKLLKEAGFDVVTSLIYMTNRELNPLFENINNLKHSDGNNPFISAPTQQLAIDWIRVNFDIHILVNIAIDDRWYFESFNLKGKRNAEILTDEEYWFNTPEEAKEAALTYVLQDLILKK